MTKGIRDAIQVKVDRHVSGEWTVITLNTDDVADLLAENQRMRELLSEAYEHLEAGQPTTAEEMIAAFLA